MSFDNPEIELPCQGCRGVMKRRLRELKKGTVLTCSCGATTKLEGDDLSRVADSLRDLERTIERFGK